jgi:hypothetical protein
VLFSVSFPVLVLGLLMSTLSDESGDPGSGVVLGPAGPFPDHAGEPYQLDEGSPKKYGSKKEYSLLKQLKPLPKKKLFGEPGLKLRGSRESIADKSNTFRRPSHYEIALLRALPKKTF